MKHLFFLLLISSRAFSQAADTNGIRFYNGAVLLPGKNNIDLSGYATGRAISINDYVIKPDTLRAICLVTLHPNGIAHARMGFVVISEGKRPVYLDCNKRALKLPQVGWGYEIVNPNNQK